MNAKVWVVLALVWGVGSRYPAQAPAPAGFRVSYYRLRLGIDPDARTITGQVDASGVIAAAGVTRLSLDLSAALVVDQVSVDGRAAPYTRAQDVVEVPLPNPLARGTRFGVTVSYHGRPAGRGFSFATHDGVPMVSSYGLPYTAREWWPCRDAPAAKADSADIEVTVPTPLVAASNGRLARVVPGRGGTRTFSWRVRYAIAPDNVSVAVTDYVTLTSTFRAPGGGVLPLEFYVYPGDSERASRDFAVVPELLRTYVTTFGEYPFPDEKYGIAEFATPSFREHQTLTAYGATLITGDHRNDRILAHELAHQWFGDFVSVQSWAHVWLNEGFATYAYALWQEQRGGDTAYRRVMAAADRDDFTGSVYIADSLNVAALFTSTTFQKGAWVLHMLRHVMGDRSFFAAVRDYLRTYAYGTVTTADFQRVCERHYGRSLDWFFREWIYGVARPVYTLGWTSAQGGAAGDSSTVTLTVRQVQTDAPAFTMPLDVVVATPRGETTRVIWDSLPIQQFVFRVAAPASAVTLDPGGWVLKRVAPALEGLTELHPGHQLDLRL